MEQLVFGPKQLGVSWSKVSSAQEQRGASPIIGFLLRLPSVWISELQTGLGDPQRKAGFRGREDRGRRGRVWVRVGVCVCVCK